MKRLKQARRSKKGRNHISSSGIMSGVENFERRMKEWHTQMAMKKERIMEVVEKYPGGIDLPTLSKLVAIPVRNVIPIVRYMVHEQKLFTVGNKAPTRARYKELWVDKNTVVKVVAP